MKSLDFEKVSVADAREALEGQIKHVDKVDRSLERLPQANAVLLQATVDWMAELPEAMRPVELARRFPRIANSVAALWRRVSRCEEYLDSLVVDRRGDRTGFPHAVALELSALRSHYVDLHPARDSTSEIGDRTR